MSAKEMRHFCGLKDATYFKMTIIDTIIEDGLVAMTQPDSPKSPTQKYYRTELGKALLEKNQRLRVLGARNISSGTSKSTSSTSKSTSEKELRLVGVLKGEAFVGL